MKCLSCPRKAEPNSNYCAIHKTAYPRRIYKILNILWAQHSRVIAGVFVALGGVSLIYSAYVWRRTSTIPTNPKYPKSAKMEIFNNRIKNLDNISVLTSQCISSKDKGRGAVTYVIDVPENGNYLLELEIDSNENRGPTYAITITWNGSVVGKGDPLNWYSERTFEAGPRRPVAEVTVQSRNNVIELLTEGKLTACDLTLIQEYQSTLAAIDGTPIFDRVNATFEFRGFADGRLITNSRIVDHRYFLDIGDGFKRRIRIVGEAHYLSQNRIAYEFVFD